MRTTPSVSTIIPTYNRAPLVSRAIRSALAASIPGDEIIVIDDGSTDDTASVVAAFGSRVRYLKVPNGGAGKARNIGIAAARKDLIAFLDSDDEWMPDKMQLQRTVMSARPDVLFCFSDFLVKYENGDEERRYLINWHHDSRSWDEILGLGVPFSTLEPLPQGRADFRVHTGNLAKPLMAALYVFTSSLVVRRDSAGANLRFAEDLPIYEDWEYFGRLALTGNAAFLDCETTWNHGHTGTRLSDAASLARATAYIQILDRVWGANAAFMEKHGTELRNVVAEQRLCRAKELIWVGNNRAAAEELQLLDRAPVAYRVLAALPSPVVRGLLSVRRTLR
jgi:glycosyltransferase involved in cell wall biosynthesis